MKIGTDRPFEPLHMTTQRWQQIEPQPVEIAALTTCQDTLSIDGLLQKYAGQANPYCDDTHVHVVNHHGQLYLCDGHHRVILAWLQGEVTIQARVLTTPIVGDILSA